MNTNLIFEQADIGIIKDKKQIIDNKQEQFFIAATDTKGTILKVYDDYIGLDCDNVYIYDDIQMVEPNDNIIIITISGKLCSEYIEKNNLYSVIKFSAHTQIMRIMNSLLNDELDLEDIDAKRRFSLVMDILIDIVFYKYENIEKTNRVVNDALYYIHENYYEIYGVEQLADKLGVSESYLIRMFKKQMDITPLKYLQKIKIEKAKQYLLQESLDTKTVAGLCGYSDANYFGKVFKKICRITPGQYRELMQDDMQDSLPDEFYL